MLVANSNTASATLSVTEKVFYANLIVVIATVAIFSIIYFFSFNNPSIEEYKLLAREGVKVYGGIIPILSFALYKQFKKIENKDENQ